MKIKKNKQTSFIHRLTENKRREINLINKSKGKLCFFFNYPEEESLLCFPRRSFNFSTFWLWLLTDPSCALHI